MTVPLQPGYSYKREEFLCAFRWFSVHQVGFLAHSSQVPSSSHRWQGETKNLKKML